MKVAPAAAAHSADVPIAKWELVLCYRVYQSNGSLRKRSGASFLLKAFASQHEILAR
jgi:hypothetical protein